MNKLTPKKKQLLKDFVNNICEECNSKKESNELEIHRINRGYMGGEYVLRNIKVICKNCHDKFHYKEFKWL